MKFCLATITPDHTDMKECEVHKIYSFLRFSVNLNCSVVVSNFIKQRHKNCFHFFNLSTNECTYKYTRRQLKHAVTIMTYKYSLDIKTNKSCCSIVRFFCRITSIYQPTNAHIISHKTLLKHFKTLRHVSILSDHHQGPLFLAKVMLQYSQLNCYLQKRCCGSISYCVGMW